mmetsp:Transcript_18903/g.60400  ORF Transcript_18903/g.60400 Transcript_18903/m.60400 type:complete len:303 (-) Transcript_18903:136-1044(-)
MLSNDSVAKRTNAAVLREQSSIVRGLSGPASMSAELRVRRSMGESLSPRVQMPRAFCLAELEEYRVKFFIKDGVRGVNTIANFTSLRGKMANSRGTGTIGGRLVTESKAGRSEEAKSPIESSRAPPTISLHHIFQHDATLKLFFAFASLRHVPESILFWSEVESLQNVSWKANRVLGILSSKPSNEEVQKRAKAIWAEYLSPDASYEVCLPHKILRDIEVAVASHNATPELFACAQTLVFRDMEKGLFPEFLQTLNHRGIEFICSCINKAQAPGLAAATALSMVQGKETSAANIFSAREEPA